MFDRLKSMIKVSEGLRLKPYKCPADKWTIGYGRNIEDNGISLEEAEFMLDNDLRNTMRELTIEYSKLVDHPESVQIALIDMCFNMGWPRLSQFKKMFAALDEQDYETAAREALDSKWARQVGKRAAHNAELIRSAE